MQWCRSLLSIGGDNLQFYPNFALFSTLGGMNLDHDFVQVRKFREDQRKKCKWNIFSPRIQVKTKKKKRSSSQIEHFFPEIFALMQTHLKYWGGCRCGPFSNYWGDTAKLLGDISSPFPLGFGTPATMQIKIAFLSSVSSACLNI